MADDLCDFKFCGAPRPGDAISCPTCGRPSLFPNVRAAQDGEERTALASRHRAAVDDAEARGCAEVVRDFENAAGTSQAVIARPLREAERLASSDRQLYSTYYKLIESEVQLPSGDKWDRLRQHADVTLFGSFNAPQIRFAALSLEDAAPATYGECSLVLREELIAYRASVFEDNSAIFMAEWGYHSEPGFRATWEERAMLCVAKLAGRLQVDTPATQFASLLMESGPTPEDDRFVEVHVWGSMTRRTLRKVRIRSMSFDGRPTARLAALRERLAEVGVELEVA
jgi:hypothetical protein